MSRKWFALNLPELLSGDATSFSPVIFILRAQLWTQCLWTVDGSLQTWIWQLSLFILLKATFPFVSSREWEFWIISVSYTKYFQMARDYGNESITIFIESLWQKRDFMPFKLIIAKGLGYLWCEGWRKSRCRTPETATGPQWWGMSSKERTFPTINLKASRWRVQGIKTGTMSTKL